MNAALGAAALATVGIFGGGAAVMLDATPSPATASDVTTVTVTTPIPACTLVTLRGQVADPCNQLTLAWEQSNRNALAGMQYYPKWKAASPVDYAQMKAWGTSPPGTPEPTARTAFGALIRYHLGICRMWTPDMARCAIP